MTDTPKKTARKTTKPAAREQQDDARFYAVDLARSFEGRPGFRYKPGTHRVDAKLKGEMEAEEGLVTDARPA